MRSAPNCRFCLPMDRIVDVMTATAFREVRRLGYFRPLCLIVAHARSIDIDLASSRLLKRAEQVNLYLNRYPRSTGRISTEKIAASYIRMAAQLGLIDLEGHVVQAAPKGLVLSVLKEGRVPFGLTLQERIFFADLLSQTEPCSAEITDLMKHLLGNPRSRFGDFEETGLGDRITKSHIEWLIDLRLVTHSLPSRGTFSLSESGLTLCRESGRLLRADLLSRAYAELHYGELRSVPDVVELREAFKESLDDLHEAVSPISRKVFAAEPVLLRTRLYLIDAGVWVSRESALDIFEKYSEELRIIFKWDPIYDGGFIKLEG